MNLIKKLSKFLNDYYLNHINYIYLHIKKMQLPKWLDLDEPETFSEKIIYLKLRYRHPNANMYADKLFVRDFISSKIGSKYLIPLIKVYNHPSEINFDDLPQRFVLKLNHGSGMNIICKNKNKLNRKKSLELINRWYKQDYSEIGREYQYKGIKPIVYAEKYMENNKEKGDLNDYKIFCFNGVPKFIQVDIGRYSEHKRAFYDL